MEQVYTGNCGYIKYRYPGCTVRKGSSSGSMSAALSFPEGKTSVNTGTFVPGVYRVNPYSIKGGKMSVLTDQSEEIWSEPYLDHNVQYCMCAWSTGPWMSARLLQLANGAILPPDFTSYQQLTLQKAYAKVGAADLDLGEQLGEYRETIKMLRAPLSELRKFLFDDRQRNWDLLLALAQRDRPMIGYLLGRTGKASARTMSNTWLELRYGLRPLVKSVQDVIEFVQSKKEGIFDPTKIRSKKSKLAFSVSDETWQQVDLRNFSCRSKCSVEHQIVVNASVQYRQSYEESVLDKLGLMPQFLPETVWNLTRASFVVDWIFSIGPWLGTLRINPLITILGNTVGTKVIRTVSTPLVEVCVTGKSPWEKARSPVHGDRYVTNTYDRVVDMDLSYKPHFTWGRTLDLWKVIDAVLIAWTFKPVRKTIRNILMLDSKD